MPCSIEEQSSGDKLIIVFFPRALRVCLRAREAPQPAQAAWPGKRYSSKLSSRSLANKFTF